MHGQTNTVVTAYSASQYGRVPHHCTAMLNSLHPRAWPPHWVRGIQSLYSLRHICFVCLHHTLSIFGRPSRPAPYFLTHSTGSHSMGTLVLCRHPYKDSRAPHNARPPKNVLPCASKSNVSFCDIAAMSTLRGSSSLSALAEECCTAYTGYAAGDQSPGYKRMDSRQQNAGIYTGFRDHTAAEHPHFMACPVAALSMQLASVHLHLVSSSRGPSLAAQQRLVKIVWIMTPCAWPSCILIISMGSNCRAVSVRSSVTLR